MTHINAGTKRGQQFIMAHRRADARDLREVYGRWSDAKERAYRECIEWYLASNQHEDFRIISANTYGFSVAWYFVDETTGEKVLRVETPSNTYFVA